MGKAAQVRHKLKRKLDHDLRMKASAAALAAKSTITTSSDAKDLKMITKEDPTKSSPAKTAGKIEEPKKTQAVGKSSVNNPATKSTATAAEKDTVKSKAAASNASKEEPEEKMGSSEEEPESEEETESSEEETEDEETELEEEETELKDDQTDSPASGSAVAKSLKKTKKHAVPESSGAPAVWQPANDRKGWKKTKKSKTTAVVDARLKELLPARRLKDVSFCLKAAILKGYIDLSVDKPLDQIIFIGTADTPCCNEAARMTIRLRDVLYQGDTGEIDGGYLKCSKCKTKFYYLTLMCTGKPAVASGAKFHNHCQDCPRFGYCMHDYRYIHCVRCGTHEWQSCEKCDPRPGSEEDSDDDPQLRELARKLFGGMP